MRKATLAVAVFVAVMGLAGCSRSSQEKAEKYLENGKELAKAKDHARAILQFRNAAKGEPKNPEPLYQMALSFLALGDPAMAVASLEKALQLDPKHMASHMKLAEILLGSRDAEVLERAASRLETAGDNLEVKQMRAAALFGAGKTNEAEQLLQEVLKQSPQHLKAKLTLALVYMSRKKLEDAEFTLKTAAAEHADSAEAQLALGRFFVLKGQPGDAERQLRLALSLNPNFAPALISLGSLQLRAGRKVEAEETYRRLSLVPEAQYKSIHAELLLQTGSKEAGIAELKQLYQKDPRDRTVRSRLVQTYLDAGNLKDAEAVVAEALGRNGKDVEALAQRSEILLRRGQVEEARKDLNEVLKYRPDSAQAHYMLAQVYRRIGSADQRKEALTQAVKLEPGLLPARLELAQTLIETDAGKAALDVLDAAPAVQRQAEAVLVQRNRALLAAGKVAEARKGISDALAKSRTPELLLQDGLVRLRQKDYAGARTSLEEALKAAPEDIRVLDSLVSSYLLANNRAAATAKVRQAAADRPKSAAIQRFAGQFLMQMGDHEGARAALLNAKAAEATPGGAEMDLATLDMREGKTAAAREKLNALLSHTPSHAGARLLLGLLEESAGNQSQAMENYRKVLVVDERNVVALNNLAYLMAEQGGNLDEALKFAQQAKELAREDFSAPDDTLGWIYYRMGIYKSAVKHLEAAVTRKSTARRQYHLAMAYSKAGDELKAKKALALALAADPSLPEAQAAREVMRAGA